MKMSQVKKVTNLIIAVLFTASLAFAETDRLTELREEGQKLVQEVHQLQEEISKRQIRIIEIQGALKELTPKTEEKKAE